LTGHGEHRRVSGPVERVVGLGWTERRSCAPGLPAARPITDDLRELDDSKDEIGRACDAAGMTPACRVLKENHVSLLKGPGFANGCYPATSASVGDQERVMLDLASGRIDRAQLAEWLRQHLKPLA